MEDPRMITLEEADWFFRRMVRRFVKERDKITIEGITLPGLMILHKLERDGEQRLGELGEELDLTSGAITALCDKLEELELAVRKRTKEDRRAVVLTITAKGRAMFHRNRNIGHGCIMALFGCFTEEELSDQVRYFKRITANLEHFSGRILRLAEENAGVPNSAPEEKNLPPQQHVRDNGNTRYLTY